MLKRKNDQKTLYKQMKLNSTTLYVISQEINSNAASILTNLISQYEKKLTNSHLCVLIQGNYGTGKTFVVHETMKQLGIRLLELNASHSRDMKNIKRVLSDAIKNFAVLQKELTSTVVFLDDIDIKLECDQGFDKAIKWLISESKCPVIMTCTTLPKKISFKYVKIIQLETSLDYLQLLYNERDRKKVKLTNTEILFLYRFYGANLNYLFNIFDQVCRFSKNFIYLIPGKILSSFNCEIQDCLDVLLFEWDHVASVEFVSNFELSEVLTWIEILTIADVSDVSLVFLEILAKIFNRHKEKIELVMRGKKKKKDFRGLGLMGNLDDYYSFKSLFNIGKK